MYTRLAFVKLAAEADGVKEIKFTLTEAELTKLVGEGGGYMPRWGVMTSSAGVLTIKAGWIQRTANPRQTAHVFADWPEYRPLAKINEAWAYDTSGLVLPKFFIEGGIDIVFEATLTGGPQDITLDLKGENLHAELTSGRNEDVVFPFPQQAPNRQRMHGNAVSLAGRLPQLGTTQVPTAPFGGFGPPSNLPPGQ